MKKAVILSLIVFALLIVVGAVQFITQRSNCGGNSAALAGTARSAELIRMALLEPDHGRRPTFKEIVPSGSWKDVFAFGWGVKSYWVLKELDSSETRPVIICAQCFGNVPQPTIWNLHRSNPAFAAGFLNGENRLLSIPEFNSIDFHLYQYVTEMDVANSKSDNDSHSPGDPQQ